MTFFTSNVDFVSNTQPCLYDSIQLELHSRIRLELSNTIQRTTCTKTHASIARTVFSANSALCATSVILRTVRYHQEDNKRIILQGIHFHISASFSSHTTSLRFANAMSHPHLRPDPSTPSTFPIARGTHSDAPSQCPDPRARCPPPR